MFKEIIPIVLILLLHNNTNSGKKYLVETEGQDEKGRPPLPDHLFENGVDYEEVNTKDKKENNTKHKKGVNTKEEKGVNTNEEKGVNTKDKKDVNSKDKKQDKDGEDYFFPFVNVNWGGGNRYNRYNRYRPRARYVRRPNYGRGGCPKK